MPSESRVFHNGGNKMLTEDIDAILNDGWSIVSVQWDDDFYGRPAAVLAVRDVPASITVKEFEHAHTS